MIQAIITILAALLPLVIEIVENRKKEKQYDKNQKLRCAVAAGDVAAISHKLDRLRQKKRIHSR